MSLRETLTPFQGTLPGVNALLNSVATALLVAGWIFIRRKMIKAHVTCMVSAVIVSTLFLSTYVTYHWLKAGLVTRFASGGLPEFSYKVILITHVILAAITPVLVMLTLVPAFQQRFDRHRKIARFTLPIWLYVSVTGVLVYLMLYRWYPQTAS